MGNIWHNPLIHFRYNYNTPWPVRDIWPKSASADTDIIINIVPSSFHIFPKDSVILFIRHLSSARSGPVSYVTCFLFLL